MSKVWDLTCTCNKQEYAACPYCIRVNEEAKNLRICATCGHPEVPHNYRHQFNPWEPSEMSADWLDDKEPPPLPPAPDKQPEGYHTTTIPKGVFGESSKILEEVLELQDAENQGARVMALHELADIIGAVEGYRVKHYPDMKFEDLVTMMNITRRAFESGHRKASSIPLEGPTKAYLKSMKSDTVTVERCWRCLGFHLGECPQDPGPAHP